MTQTGIGLGSSELRPLPGRNIKVRTLRKKIGFSAVVSLKEGKIITSSAYNSIFKPIQALKTKERNLYTAQFKPSNFTCTALLYSVDFAVLFDFTLSNRAEKDQHRFIH